MLSCSLRHTKACNLTPELTWRPKKSSQQCCENAQKPSRRQLTWWPDIRRRTGSYWIGNWKTPSIMLIAKFVCTWDRSWSDYVRNSWIGAMSALKPVFSLTTTSAALRLTQEPWPSTHWWKRCSESFLLISGLKWWWPLVRIPEIHWHSNDPACESTCSTNV